LAPLTRGQGERAGQRGKEEGVESCARLLSCDDAGKTRENVGKRKGIRGGEEKGFQMKREKGRTKEGTRKDIDLDKQVRIAEMGLEVRKRGGGVSFLLGPNRRATKKGRSSSPFGRSRRWRERMTPRQTGGSYQKKRGTGDQQKGTRAESGYSCTLSY